MIGYDLQAQNAYDDENKKLKAIIREVHRLTTMTPDQNEYAVLDGMVQEIMELTRGV